jgi:hypothetical protein
VAFAEHAFPVVHVDASKWFKANAGNIYVWIIPKFT